MTSREHMQSLYRYFFWADQMRWNFYLLLLARGWEKAWDDEEIRLYCTYWYGALFVVIEGWQELNLHDPYIDTLLESPYVGLLKRYRNGAFHFQKKYDDERFTEFIKESKESSEWVTGLHKQFERFFQEWLAQQRREADDEDSSRQL